MIDPSIISNGANNALLIQQNNMEQLGQLGGNLGQLVLGRRLNQMGQLGTVQEQQAFANKSVFAPQLNNQLKSNAATALRNQMDFDEHQAKVGKLRAESGKIGAETGEVNTKNSTAKVATQSSIWASVAQGGGMAGKNQAAILLKNGLIDQAEYDAYSTQIDQYKDKPAELMQLAFGQYKAMQDPKYNLTTADNVLDNQTSIQNNELTNQTSLANNQNTVNASRYSTDVGAQTAQARLAQDGQQFDAELYIKKNKPLDYFTAADGTRYAVYADGKGIPITNSQGDVIKEKPKNSETPVQQMERKEKTVDFSTAAQGAAEGSKLAATLANDLTGINSAGGTSPVNWAARKIPGTDAYNYAQKLETLKANVFLSQVLKMKGMGALTEAEGARLEKAIASLDVGQDPVQLQKNLTEIAKQLSLIAQTNSKKTKIYAGVPTESTNTQAPSNFDVKGFFNE